MRTLVTRLRHRPWVVAALAAFSVVGLLLSAFIAAPPSSAADSGCRVDYTVNQWSGGYTAAIKVTNLGPAITSWRLTWTYGGDQQVTSAWNATVSQSGKAVTATDAGWNGGLATGGSADFGVQGTYQSANPTPTDFAVNGVACGGTTTPTDPGTPTTPPPTTPPPTDPPSSGDCGGAVVCSGFEDQSGATPSGAWQFVAPDCQGSGTVTVDTSVAHTGAKSMRVDGKAGYCNHAFVGTTANLSSVSPVYIRMWVRHTTALPAGHVAFVSMPDTSQGGKALRIGGQNGALQWNREIDDATLPAQSPAGVAQSRPLPTGSWQCLRFMINTSNGNLDTWLGDEQVPGLHADGVPTADIDQQWLSRTTAPRPTALRLGWESYGGGDDTLWFDDVAVGSSPIGC
ncbi:cellulose-binding domain-containing protein [Streptomyces sp. NPDC048106]|uniref:cellulose-binding domain-containing protein n=1 Tax=Streptomyces sp. NPDC048106 TaxID=3155750 RepID=UPI0034529396